MILSMLLENVYQFVAHRAPELYQNYTLCDRHKRVRRTTKQPSIHGLDPGLQCGSVLQTDQALVSALHKIGLRDTKGFGIKRIWRKLADGIFSDALMGFCG